jgi:hypothetical protein
MRLARWQKVDRGQASELRLAPARSGERRPRLWLDWTRLLTGSAGRRVAAAIAANFAVGAARQGVRTAAGAEARDALEPWPSRLGWGALTQGQHPTHSRGPDRLQQRPTRRRGAEQRDERIKARTCHGPVPPHQPVIGRTPPQECSCHCSIGATLGRRLAASRAFTDSARQLAQKHHIRPASAAIGLVVSLPRRAKAISPVGCIVPR